MPTAIFLDDLSLHYEMVLRECEGTNVRKSKQSNGNGNYPTLQDIADRCGVSRATVSRAIRAVPGEQSEATAQHIVAVARDMGYDPMRFQGARRLIAQRHGSQALSYLLGFFFQHKGFGQSNYFATLFRGVLDGVIESVFEIVTSEYRLEVDNFPNIPAAYRRGDIDGALVYTQRGHWGPMLTALRNEPNFANRPMVSLAEPLENCSGVYPDNISAGYLALSHLLALGHRHVLVTHPGRVGGDSVEDQRWTGYHKACSESGVEMTGHLHVLDWNHKDSEDSGRRFIEHLKRHPQTSALIAANDLQAAQIHRELSKDIRIPEDVSLISYDDTETITDGRGNNILSTVRLPLVEVGKLGAEFLIRRVTGEEKEDRDIVLPVELIVRGSTAPPRRK